MSPGDRPAKNASLIGIKRAGEPLRTARAAAQQQQILADLRFEREVEALCRLGPRAVAELLARIGRDYLIRTAIDQLVADSARRLTPELLAALGGDRFPQ